MGITSYDISQTTRLVNWGGVWGGGKHYELKEKGPHLPPLTFWCKGTAGVLACVPGNMLFLTLGFGPYGIASPSRKGKPFCFIES